MAVFTRKKAPAAGDEPPRRRQSLVASAIRFRFDDPSYGTWRFRDEAWQREAWRLMGITPELRFAANWVGQCCSQVRIYVANVDELGRVQGETKDRRIQALSDNLLGGPAAKAEHLRMMGIDLTIAGECYIVGQPDENTKRDEWWVLSPTEFRRVRGANGEWEWAYGDMDSPFRINPARNVVTRLWTPHPERVWNADSPTRSCLIILRELEQLTKLVASEIDSRLVGNGIFVIPNNLDLPQDENVTNNADSLMTQLAEAGAASLRGEGTALGVLPHIIEADPSVVDGFRHITFATELQKQAIDLRKEAIERLGVGMDMPPEVLSGMGSTSHWCLDEETRIYTKDRGWVSQQDLSIGDTVLTLNPETQASEWQPVLDIYRADVVDEPMLSMEGTLHSSLSTRGHRWITSAQTGGLKWTTSAEGFGTNRMIPVSAKNGQAPIVAKYEDDFVRLVAAYTSDGTPINLVKRGNGRPKIHITKFKAVEISEMRRILASVYGPHGTGWTETVERTGKAGCGVRFHIKSDASLALFDVAPGRIKAVKTSFVDDLTTAQRALLLESMIDIGDGVARGGSMIFTQVEKARLTAFERAAILLGRGVQWARQTPKQTAFGTRDLHILTVSRRKITDPRYATRTWRPYTGVVWCPTTPNGTWFAQRNGRAYFTGNSGYLIDGHGIKVHIEPLMNRICDALTKAYLYPVLKLLGKDPSRYTFAYDTTPLQLRPQRGQDALNLYEKGVLSAEALLDALYFKQSDAAPVEEKVRRFLQEILLRDPQLLQNQAVREGAGIPEEIIDQTAMIAPTPSSVAPGSLGGTGIGSGPPPPPVPPTGIKSALPPPVPMTFDKLSEGPAAPTNPGGDSGPTAGTLPPIGMRASAAPNGADISQAREEMGVVVLAEATVRRGLELAGKRLLDRANRNRWHDVPPHELHTRIRVEDQAHANRLLAGAWNQLEATIKVVSDTVDTERLQGSLTNYCSRLLLAGEAHEPPTLYAALQADGFIHG